MFRPALRKNIRKALIQSWKGSSCDLLEPWAAAISYYAILSVVPLCVGAVSIASYVADPAWVTAQLGRALQEFTPKGDELITQMISTGLEHRSSAGILSIALLLYSGGKVFAMLAQGINLIFNTGENRGYLKRLLIQIIMTLSVGSIFLLAAITPALLQIVGWMLGYIPYGSGLLTLLKFMISPFLFFGAFFLLYRFLPQGRTSSYGATAGAILATVLFLIARPLFLFYVQEFASFSSLYGPFAIAITLIVWTWTSAYIVLFGAEYALHFHALHVEQISTKELEDLHEKKAEKFTEPAKV